MEATVARENVLEQAHTEISIGEATNPLANMWLVVLATLLGGTLFCTAILVAWPIVAKMVAG